MWISFATAELTVARCCWTFRKFIHYSPSGMTSCWTRVSSISNKRFEARLNHGRSTIVNYLTLILHILHWSDTEYTWICICHYVAVALQRNNLLLGQTDNLSQKCCGFVKENPDILGKQLFETKKNSSEGDPPKLLGRIMVAL